MIDPITYLQEKRDTLASPVMEQKLASEIFQLRRKINTVVIDGFGIRMLERYEGGLTQQERLMLLREWNTSVVKKKLIEVLFNHYVSDGDNQQHLRRAFQARLQNVFSETIVKVYTTEAESIAFAYRQGSSFLIESQVTGQDRQRLRQVVIGGSTIKEYVRRTLVDLLERLSNRIKQVIMAETTSRKMVLRMKVEIKKVLGTFEQHMKNYQFEVVTYGANLSQLDFIEALRGVTT